MSAYVCIFLCVCVHFLFNFKANPIKRGLLYIYIYFSPLPILCLYLCSAFEGASYAVHNSAPRYFPTIGRFGNLSERRLFRHFI